VWGNPSGFESRVAHHGFAGCETQAQDGSLWLTIRFVEFDRYAIPPLMLRPDAPHSVSKSKPNFKTPTGTAT